MAVSLTMVEETGVLEENQYHLADKLTNFPKLDCERKCGQWNLQMFSYTVRFVPKGI